MGHHCGSVGRTGSLSAIVETWVSELSQGESRKLGHWSTNSLPSLVEDCPRGLWILEKTPRLRRAACRFRWEPVGVQGKGPPPLQVNRGGNFMGGASIGSATLAVFIYLNYSGQIFQLYPSHISETCEPQSSRSMVRLSQCLCDRKYEAINTMLLEFLITGKMLVKYCY